MVNMFCARKSLLSCMIPEVIQREGIFCKQLQSNSSSSRRFICLEYKENTTLSVHVTMIMFVGTSTNLNSRYHTLFSCMYSRQFLLKSVAYVIPLQFGILQEDHSFGIDTYVYMLLLLLCYIAHICNTHNTNDSVLI